MYVRSKILYVSRKIVKGILTGVFICCDWGFKNNFLWRKESIYIVFNPVCNPQSPCSTTLANRLESLKSVVYTAMVSNFFVVELSNLFYSRVCSLYFDNNAIYLFSLPSPNADYYLSYLLQVLCGQRMSTNLYQYQWILQKPNYSLQHEFFDL